MEQRKVKTELLILWTVKSPTVELGDIVGYYIAVLFRFWYNCLSLST